ncbi:MAG: hypothetical protein RL660_1701 [Bacteroidota bacterium]|jgi:hypothetical protein
MVTQRKLFIVLISLTFFASCSESFKRIDPTSFNEKIKNATNIKTPEELVKIFYNYPATEKVPKLTTYAKKLGDSTYEITLVHEGLEDDSQSGEKIVMKAKQDGQTWVVIEIRKNWKCWEGRGQKNWETIPCN